MPPSYVHKWDNKKFALPLYQSQQDKFPAWMQITKYFALLGWMKMTVYETCRWALGGHNYLHSQKQRNNDSEWKEKWHPALKTRSFYIRGAYAILKKLVRPGWCYCSIITAKLALIFCSSVQTYPWSKAEGSWPDNQGQPHDTSEIFILAHCMAGAMFPGMNI